MKVPPVISRARSFTARRPARKRSLRCASSESARRRSISPATRAARAPGETSSVGMIMSDSSSTSANSAGVKNRAAKACSVSAASGRAESSGSTSAAALAPSISRRVSNVVQRSVWSVIGSPSAARRRGGRRSATRAP